MNRSEEVTIRKALVEAGVIDCIVAMPTKLSANTQIPVSLWFVSKDRSEHGTHRDRTNETLFIDARKHGQLVSRRQRELSQADLNRITSTYHSFRNLDPENNYADIDGFCKAASTRRNRERRTRSHTGSLRRNARSG